jgi:uncharacterized coiled-coil DUF342 family protein
MSSQVSEAQFAQVTADFMLADLGLALTFAESARTASTEARKSRNRENARKAYDKIQEFFLTKSVSPKAEPEIAAKLALLKQALTALGETFPE